MGLIHPADLKAWQQWHARQRPAIARLKGWAREVRGSSPHGVLASGGPHSRIVIAIEAPKSTTVAAQLSVLRHLDLRDVAVLAPSSVRHLLSPHAWTESTGPLGELAERVVTTSSVVLSTGHYLGIGAAARAALSDPSRFLTIQHGLLTPHAPPLAAGTTVLAWSEADGTFWRSGREDVTLRAVGSQLLWEAARKGQSVPALSSSSDEPPVYLGQLHGAELARDVLAAAARDFCLTTGATYRPHPSETDRLSLRTHAQWQELGIVVDRSGTPLTDVGRPVVSVYSTGVLEAAAAGLPAWVALPDPPRWLVDFWDRQGMSRWREAPTAPRALTTAEPARTVAETLAEMVA